MNLILKKMIHSKIFCIRGKNVILDRDIAELYGVETKQLKRQVRRNSKRFPSDFMFILTTDEFKNLRCQSGSSRWGGTRYPPFAFTEQGVAMLSSILQSSKAIRVNIKIIRVFIELRELAQTNKEIISKLNLLEGKSKNHDKEIKVIFEAIRKLLISPTKEKPLIGFKPKRK